MSHALGQKGSASPEDTFVVICFAIPGGSRDSPTVFATVATPAMFLPSALDQKRPSSTKGHCDIGFCRGTVLQDPKRPSFTSRPCDCCNIALVVSSALGREDNKVLAKSTICSTVRRWIPLETLSPTSFNWATICGTQSQRKSLLHSFLWGQHHSLRGQGLFSGLSAPWSARYHLTPGVNGTCQLSLPRAASALTAGEVWRPYFGQTICSLPQRLAYMWTAGYRILRRRNPCAAAKHVFMTSGAHSLGGHPFRVNSAQKLAVSKWSIKIVVLARRAG